MRTTLAARIPWAVLAPVLAPVLAAVELAVAWGSHPGALAGSLIGVGLIAAVLAGVHHAEVVAHRIGEPLGSLVLAVAVTVIEVGLIVALMAGGGDDASTLARDTVFAAVMITVNGIAGVALLVGALRHHLAVFNPEGTGSSLATVLTLAGLTLVVPTFTVSQPGPVFTGSQLTFAAVTSLALYGMFVFTQTVRHRDFFLPVGDNDADGDGHADPPSARTTWASLALLVVSLVAVVGLAKVESYPIKDAVHSLGFPEATVGVVIALLVLLPELIAAVRAALRDEVQISLNLAYGSAMASIGLTIPAIALATVWIDGPLALGLDQLQLALLTLTGVVGVLTVVPGRAKPLNGFVHLVLLAAFLFLTVKP
jgi:Ca2+:H+ antiporter